MEIANVLTSEAVAISRKQQLIEVSSTLAKEARTSLEL